MKSATFSFRKTLLCAVASCLLGIGAAAQVNSGSDGSDGAFTFVGDPGNANVMTIHLSQALSGPGVTWQTSGAGAGVYDLEQWAIVFKYTTITVPVGKTVVFTNHSSRAPVVWLATGPVLIQGTVLLNGANGINTFGQEAGPGGFRGGLGSTLMSSGFGPGGGHHPVGNNHASGGGYGSLGETQAGVIPGAIYGSAAIFPLIGGSGGGAGNVDAAGGGGGGAILIASNSSVSVPGTISALGGNGWDNGSLRGGGGSGGAVRIGADVVTIAGAINVSGGTVWNNGGHGRIRVEGETSLSIQGQLVPAGSFTTSSTVGPLFLSSPVARLYVGEIIVNGSTYQVPDDPSAKFDAAPNTDVQVLGATGPATLRIQAVNLPASAFSGGQGPPVKIRVSYTQGTAAEYTTGPLVGDEIASSVDFNVTLSNGISNIQLRALLP